MHCGRLAFTAALHEHRPPAMVSPAPSPHAQERGNQAASTASSPASPAGPSPSVPLQSPESAYHSLPTEVPQADAVLSSSLDLQGDSTGEQPSSSSSSSSLGPPLSFHLSSPESSLDPSPCAVQLHRDAVALPPTDALSTILPRTQQRSQDVPQEREVSRYRLALRRMADDLVSLHQRVTSLEVENGHLRHSLAGHQEPGHALLTDGDVDVMTREEVLDRLATLKGELVSSTAEMRQLRDRVQRLQNELIRKNDQEKELVLLQRAHRQQQADLRRCQEEVARTKGLEEVVRQQEKVIRVMERMLQEKLSRSAEKPAGEAPAGELHAQLLAESRRPWEELVRPPFPPLPPGTPLPPQDTFSGTEKLSLLAKLEEAQARGRAMERQLEEAARRWAREKQELGTRLLEQDHGFGGSAPHFLHATTLKRPPEPTLPPRRPRTLDPLP
ncbi:coiled-coil domain-containing protein 33 isoform X1 [Excalfactoria chinensis]|uniref:coiled-coil domain-containing protein 33 isoform X1 n=1 Tax=Excalfactoria chinensis TaxID=46218 RepID=UPI003B3BAAF5